MELLMISPRYAEDIKRILKAAIDIDIIMSPEEADKLWSDYSNELYAGWLRLPESDESLRQTIRRVVTGV
ncbi:hypothetical protein B5G96_15555 [Listeria monocytogenes]|uniref:hypothetical protein n=1 Tax=uncultured Enterococcus sp. TaxID=167972 RepID=UPI000FC26205|nr:hypothetical protein [uncultured Enterococcus sp.]EAC2325834.1 hypothetical protein [Listeria monocytogenes]EAC2648372.1 hypothetical protein [Listeria monocytogenes]EAC3851629.1 hypothetical protein [Listeria monocytogenes]EAC3854959.1 hypothetical protein [Listeria monocytogenes]EAC3864554.1 hypothetical protein [Listeria monocytogenes]